MSRYQLEITEEQAFVIEPGNGQRFAAILPGVGERTNMRHTRICEMAQESRAA